MPNKTTAKEAETRYIRIDTDAKILAYKLDCALESDILPPDYYTDIVQKDITKCIKSALRLLDRLDKPKQTVKKKFN